MTSKGPNVNIFWGNTEMTDDQKFENLQTLMQNLPEIIPRGTNNIKGINLQVKIQKKLQQLQALFQQL